ncbi:MAG: hypothetical protein KGZ74_02495 [Chitinophagaceae bacterium]|nr:hypothetical protein [Chitinophagaceae bacterium]
MKKLITIVVVLSLFVLFSFISKQQRSSFEFHEKLSEYQFFKGELNHLLPADGIVPYDLNTPLFSNYAEKARFIKLPAGRKVKYNADSVFEMPIGTVLIKNFYYLHDFRDENKGRRIIETRLLVNQADGWATYQYIWNKEQTEAIFEPIGDITTVEYIDAAGKKISAPYVIPTQAQCMGCHKQNGFLQPIGIAARHLNGDHNYTTGKQNQLQYWQQHGMIDLPSASIPANAVWNKEQSGTLEQRARAYLDINCGHCHNDNGPGSSSGLFLDIHETDATKLGINKTPVAAGRASGNLSFDIHPGKPEKSIVIYRMRSTDPGIAMPEVGREQLHKEGIALISQWIKEMN